MLSLKSRFTVIALISSLTGASAIGQIITLSAVDRGWYKSNGSAAPDNQNYVAGYSYGAVYNNFFVFDSDQFLGGSLISAKLRVFNPSLQTSQLGDGYSSPDASETIVLHAFSGNVQSLMNGTGGVTAYTDLGDGAIFGSATVTAAKNGQWIDFILNDSFLGYAGSATDLLAIGGTLSTYSGGTFFDQRVFGFSNDLTAAPQLVLEFSPSAGPSAVPEPSTYALFGTLFLLGAVLWRKRAVRASE
ncbi:MAG: PEP-CTERM sorting domain-containing protein [Nibricoccus sp.]